MKKSLLALAVLAAASANAATVFDKDGTSLAIGGRVQAIAYSGNFDKAGEDDASLVNSARLNIAGTTKVNDFVSAYAFTEWDTTDGNGNNSFSARDQYVGADFGAFGKIQGGKSLNSIYDVQAATDVFEETGALMQGNTNGDRRNGTIRYIYDNNGIYAAAAFQTAADKIKVAGEKFDAQNGYSVGLGYTFDNVVFGPLSVKAAYDYVNGQNDNKDAFSYDENGNRTYEKLNGSFKNTAVSVAWGNASEGLYLAALYNIYKLDYDTAAGIDSQDQVKGYELVAGYTFDNGLGVTVGYEMADKKSKVGSVRGQSAIARRVPVIVNYQLAPNFKVWAEAEFDANSSDNIQTVADDRNAKDNKFAAGARYVF